MANEESGAVKAEETKNEANPTTPLSEADLAKSLRELEGKTEEETKEEPAQPTVEATKLEKNTAQAIQDNGSAGLKRSLEVSQVLGEFSTVIGDHVDASLEVLQKSIQQSADRDLAVVSVMTELKKSIDTLAEKMEAYGNAPATTPKSVVAADVLQKNTGDPEQPKSEQVTDPAAVRKQVSLGLVELQKHAEPNTPDAQKYQNKALRFEATGEIDDQTLQKAISAYRKSLVA